MVVRDFYFPLDLMDFLFDLIGLSVLLVLEPIDTNTRFKCLLPNFIPKTKKTLDLS